MDNDVSVTMGFADDVQVVFTDAERFIIPKKDEDVDFFITEMNLEVAYHFYNAGEYILTAITQPSQKEESILATIQTSN